MNPCAMLLAVSACERFLAAGVAPAYAVHSAAHLHCVDADELAVRVLEKMVGVQRARTATAAMNGADQALEHAPDAQRCIAPRARVSRGRTKNQTESGS